MKDPISKLRSATRRAKSDVANKLISMCLHEMSRRISQNWPIKVDGEEYEKLVRERFGNKCPYCSRDLTNSDSVIEHLDGMNRFRAGLHVPGNVLVACKKCNGEKRRDDSLRILSLAQSGWESFLSHDGTRCAVPCRTCLYWESIWGGWNRAKITIEREFGKSAIISQRIFRISASSAHPHGDAASAVDEALHRLSGLCRKGNQLPLDR